jgi:hypothetical protein
VELSGAVASMRAVRRTKTTTSTSGAWYRRGPTGWAGLMLGCTGGLRPGKSFSLFFCFCFFSISFYFLYSFEINTFLQVLNLGTADKL